MREINTWTDFLDAIIDAASVNEEYKKKDELDSIKNKPINNEEKPCVESKLPEVKENPCKNNGCVYQLPVNLTIVDDNHYVLKDMVNNFITCNESHIIFNHTDNNGYTHPGIKESQLLAILYDRYKNNPKKLDLVRQLMN